MRMISIVLKSIVCVVNVDVTGYRLAWDLQSWIIHTRKHPLAIETEIVIKVLLDML